MDTALGFVKHHAVVLIAFLAAAISCVFTPPDGEYWHYFETRTLMCLAVTMAIIGAMNRVGFVTAVAQRLIDHFHSRRRLFIGLVYGTALWSMLISNDMALLTFLPLTYIVFKQTDNLHYLAYAFVLEATAANLGGMLTPFGSPQNLFLYSHFHIGLPEFFSVMTIPFVAAMLMMTGLCFLVPDDHISDDDVEEEREDVHAKLTAVYVVLFAVMVCILFRVFPIWVGFVIPIVIAVTDRHSLLKLDYPLLLTFVFFFIFSGNVARIESVEHFFSDLLETHVLLWSAVASQVMSNVPTAILFSEFTKDYREILAGVNIGGVGTPIASLASLIVLAKYQEYQPGQMRRFLLMFTAVNVGLLVVLFAVMKIAFNTVL